MTLSKWEGKDVEDPEETNESVGDHREVVKALRINHLISKHVVSRLLGSEKTPIHVVVPGTAIERGNQIRDDVHVELALVFGNRFLAIRHDENEWHDKF